MENNKINLPPEFEISEDQDKHRRFLEELNNAGVRFENPRDFELGEIDYSFFEDNQEKNIEKIKEIFTYCREFLAMPFQYDKFENDHGARREWEQNLLEKFGKEYHDMIDRSKFAISQMRIPVISLNHISLYIDKDKQDKYKEFIQQLKINQEFWTEIIDDYDNLSIEEKKKRIKMLEDKIYQILKHVEELTNTK